MLMYVDTDLQSGTWKGSIMFLTLKNSGDANLDIMTGDFLSEQTYNVYKWNVEVQQYQTERKITYTIKHDDWSVCNTFYVAGKRASVLYNKLFLLLSN